MFRKEFAILVVAGSVVFGMLSGCSRKPKLETTRYENKAEGFSIGFPSGWDIKEGFKEVTVIAISPTGENVSVVVEELPEALSVEQYFERRERHFEEHEIGQISIDNRDSKWTIISTQAKSVDVMVVQYYLVDGRRAYAITCAAARDKFPQYRDKFQEIAKSFRFE